MTRTQEKLERIHALANSFFEDGRQDEFGRARHIRVRILNRANGVRIPPIVNDTPVKLSPPPHILAYRATHEYRAQIRRFIHGGAV